MTTLSDAELNRLVAEKVAGSPPLFTLMKRGYYYRPDAAGYTSRIEDAWKVTEEVANEHVYPHDEPVTKHRLPHPDYATSADAVLPLLEKWWLWQAHWKEGHYSVLVAPKPDPLKLVAEGWTASADTFARAAVLALLKAAGVEV